MLGPHTVTVVQPAERDGWGDTQAGDASTAVAGCFWQPRGSQEETAAGHDLVTADAVVFMPPAAVIGPTSRVVFDGATYEVRGRPELHRTPAGPHHYEVNLVQVEGG